MSDSENQGAWEYTGLAAFAIDDGNRYHREGFKVETKRGDRVGLMTSEWYAKRVVRDHNTRIDLESQLTTLKAQLEAAEGKAALADVVLAEHADGCMNLQCDKVNDAIAAYTLSAPASDTGSMEKQDAG